MSLATHYSDYPIPQTYDLPESPFLYLKRYERKHAEVFFGRSNLIRSVYTYVTDRNAPGIILFYGQSGVGKSSFLDAGLQPRLEKEYDILYLRRDGDLGLSETVYRSLLNKAGVILNALENEQLHEVVENRKIVENLKFISDAVNPDIKIEIDQIISKLKVTDFEPERSELPDKNQLPTIQAAWKYIENKSGRPLLIILDQVRRILHQLSIAAK
ncbi:MAG: ATP-binding protein [Saprospiraceae bacterium]|nr:ATP-binding protein [Saprospiraceae bacterium]